MPIERLQKPIVITGFQNASKLEVQRPLEKLLARRGFNTFEQSVTMRGGISIIHIPFSKRAIIASDSVAVRPEIMQAVPTIIVGADQEGKKAADLLDAGAQDFIRLRNRPEDTARYIVHRLENILERLDRAKNLVKELDLNGIPITIRGKQVSVGQNSAYLSSLYLDTLNLFLKKQGELVSHTELATLHTNHRKATLHAITTRQVQAMRSLLKGTEYNVRSVVGKGYVLDKR